MIDRRSARFAILLATLAGFATMAVADPPLPVQPRSLEALRTIVLDPGHGGSNEGAVGVAQVYERYLTLALAKLLHQRLQAQFPQLEVLLTRQIDIDLDLGARTHFANLHQADLFISIHFNAALNTQANGIEVYYLSAEEDWTDLWPADLVVYGPTDIEVASILEDLRRTQNHQLSAEFAEILQVSLIAATGATDRGVRQERFRVLRGALMPAVVAELGFLTHPEEGFRVLDRDYLEALAEGFVRAIGEYDGVVGSF